MFKVKVLDRIQIILALSFYSFFIHAEKPLTLLVYAAGDNNLASSLLYNIKQMKEVHNPDINILVYLFLPPESDGIKKAYKICVTHGKATVIETDYDKDSGDPKTLIHACSWALTKYPSDHFGIIASDHGTGIISRFPEAALRGFCYDDTTGNFLDDVKLIQALDVVTTTYRAGKKIDFVGFDACLMAHQEIATAVAPYADYMIASQQTELADGWPYNKFLTEFKNPLSFIQKIIKDYGVYYTTIRKTKDFTLSAFDLNLVETMNNKIDTLALSLMQTLDITELKSPVKKAVTNSLKSFFAEKTSQDIHYFCTQFSLELSAIGTSGLSVKNKNILATMQEQTLDIKKALTNLIIAETHGSGQTFAHGASLYFPQKRIESSYKKTYWYTISQWPNFLEKFFSI
jgi:hypothetical protein